MVALLNPNPLKGAVATAHVGRRRAGVGLGGAPCGGAGQVREWAGAGREWAGKDSGTPWQMLASHGPEFQKTVTGVRRFHWKFHVLLTACPVRFKNRIPVSLGNTARVSAEVREAEVSEIPCGRGTCGD